MSLHQRLDRLEALAAQRAAAAADDHFARRWAVSERILALLGAADDLPEDEVRRLGGALLLALGEPPDPADPDGFMCDYPACARPTDSPLSGWLMDLWHGRSVLPDDLSPATLLAVLRAQLSEDAESWITQVCNRCRLPRPRRRLPPVATWRLLPGKVAGEEPGPWYGLPAELFPAGCPHCGETAWTWSSWLDAQTGATR